MWDYIKANHTPTKYKDDTALMNQRPSFLQRILLRPHQAKTFRQSVGSMKRKCKKGFIIYSPVDIISYLKKKKYNMQWNTLTSPCPKMLPTCSQTENTNFIGQFVVTGHLHRNHLIGPLDQAGTVFSGTFLGLESWAWHCFPEITQVSNEGVRPVNWSSHF